MSAAGFDTDTDVARALTAWKADLIGDLGGTDAISVQEMALVNEAAVTKLLLDSVNVWLLQQRSIINLNHKMVIPLVYNRNTLVNTLRQLLCDLGLERRAKQVASIHAIAAEYASKPAANTSSGSAAAPPPAEKKSNGEAESP